MTLFKGIHQATGDLDLANHHIRNWRDVSDVPTSDSPIGYVLTVSSAGVAAWEEATGGDGGDGGGVTDIFAGTNITVSSDNTISVVATPTFAGTVAAPAFEEGGTSLALKYAAIVHKHDLDDLQQDGAASGDVIQWDGTSWTASSVTWGEVGSKPSLVNSVSVGTGLSATTSTGDVTLSWTGTTNTREAMVIWSVGESSTLTTGLVGWLPVPFDGQLTEGWLLLDATGSIDVDVWLQTITSHPATNGDSITGGSELTISGGDSYRNTTLTAWSTTITAGDILYFNIDSSSTATQVTIGLRMLKDIS